MSDFALIIAILAAGLLLGAAVVVYVLRLPWTEHWGS
jgi:hypothetical protein